MIELVLALLSGAAGGIIIALMPRASRRLRNIIALTFVVLGAVFAWRVAGMALNGQVVGISWEIGGLPWSLQPDPLGAVFGLIASTLWLFATVYSFGYMAKEHKQGTYYTFLLLAFSVTLGVAFGNLAFCICSMNYYVSYVSWSFTGGMKKLSRPAVSIYCTAYLVPEPS